MNTKHRNIINSEAQYTKIYEKMRGVDLSADAGNAEERYAYTENMYVDYENDGLAVESVPGFRKLFPFDATINGLYTQNLDTDRVYLLVHAGTALYRIDEAEIDILGTLEPIAELKNKKSCSFTVGRTVYILDGESMIAVDEYGNAVTVSDDSPMAPYVPTTYRNRKRYEQRNLLTDKFRESFVLTTADEVSYGSYGLRYRVLNAIERTCCVSGVDESVSGTVHIPSYTNIGGNDYAVTEIDDSAFWGNEAITELITNVGLLKVDRYAFWGAKNLKRIILSSTVESIGEYSFYGCKSIEYLAIGAAFKEFGRASLAATNSMKMLYYDGSEEGFAEIANLDVIGTSEVKYHISHPEISLGLRLATPTASVSRVTVNGEDATYTYDPRCATIRMDYAQRGDVEGRDITVYGTIDNDGYRPDTAEGDYLVSRFAGRMSPRECIFGSTVSEIFDGRVFLSGNPSLGGSVFYNTSPVGEEPSPLYFGSHCYFIDGVNDHPVKSILASHGALAVFKGGDDSSGSIFYHSPTDIKSSPYSTSYVHSRINVIGGAYNYNDESIFITDSGVSMLDKYSTAGYREVRRRSSAVDKLLTACVAGGVSVSDWLGYLVICAGDTFFLGDGRRRRTKYSSQEYEWFILKGIGSYKNATRVYRYGDSAPSGYYVHDKVGCLVDETVYSYTNAYGKTYYTLENSKKYVVYPTEELKGGNFYPATLLLAIGKRLYFATECGDLCVFNNDMNGIPPEYVSRNEGFDAVEYERVMGDRLHPYFYLFDRHMPSYSLVTAWDDCGVPYLTKRTVGNSMIIKCKAPTGGKLRVEVQSDVSGSKSFDGIEIDPMSTVGIGDIPLLRSTDRHTVAVNDRTSSFCEKRVAIYSEDPHAPFGIYSISYRYRIKGKIKRKELT